jgi:hypothetical protein
VCTVEQQAFDGQSVPACPACLLDPHDVRLSTACGVLPLLLPYFYHHHHHYRVSSKSNQTQRKSRSQTTTFQLFPNLLLLLFNAVNGNQGQLQARLAEAVQHAAAAAVHLTSGNQQQQQQQQPVAAFVSDVAAFPGCWQLVMQLVLPAGQEGCIQQRLLQAAAEQVLGSWPDCSLQSMQLLSVEPAAAAAAGAAAAAAVEEEEEDSVAATGSAVVPAEQQLPSVAAELPYLQPVAVAIAGDNSSSSSNVCGNAAAAAATAWLWIPAAQVQQLVQAGQRSVRVVVTPAQLPAGQLLLDKTWQLPSTAAPAAAEADAAPSATAAASECKDNLKPVRLQLQLSLGIAAGSAEMMTPAIAAASVLSATVLAGGGATAAASAAAAAAASAAAAAAAEPSEPQTAEERTPRPAHVLAKLPLLLLPAAAADELHQLYTALVAAGASCSTAYQQLLPLLQDMAGVLMHAAAAAAASDVGSTASTAHQSSSSSSLMAEIVDELAACFARQGMDSCLQLLPQLMRQHPAAAAAAAADQPQIVPPIKTAAAADDADVGVAAARSRQLLPQVVTPQTAAAAEDGQQQTTAAAAGKLSSSSMAGDHESTGSTESREASSGSRPASSTAASHEASKADGCLKDAATGAGASNGGKDSVVQHSKHSSSSKSGGGDRGASSVAEVAPQQQRFDARAHPASAFRITSRSLLFGFPEAAVESAYGCYKTCMLRVPCLVLFLLLHAALACVCTVRLVRLLLHGSSNSSSSSGAVLDHTMQVNTALLRLLYPAMHTASHLLVWAAGSLQHWQRQPHWLGLVREHSGAVLSAGMLLPTVALAASALTGGSWAAACAANNAAFLAVPWVFCVFRHIVEPFQFRAGVLVTFVALAVQLLLFDPLYTRPQLLGLGANGTALLLCCVQLAVSSLLELSMRRRFVASAMASRAAT